MVQVGQRVQVKKSSHSYVKMYGGLTGTVVKTGYYDWEVEFDGSHEKGAFCTDELIVLGGKHAGQPHPENFTGVPTDRWEAKDQIEWGWLGTKHGHPPDHEAEIEAWEAARDLL